MLVRQDRLDQLVTRDLEDPWESKVSLDRRESEDLREQLGPKDMLGHLVHQDFQLVTAGTFVFTHAQRHNMTTCVHHS